MSKKSAAKQKDDQTYDIRDIVLAKLRGYPTWPAMVVDPETVPASVKKERPGNKKASFYCVRFFPHGDYSWLLPRDLSKLRKHEIEAYIAEPHKKSGDLLTGYEIALNPEEWERDMDKKRGEQEENEENEQVDQLDDEEEEEDGTDGSTRVTPKTKTSHKDKDKENAGGNGKGAKKRKRETDPTPGAKKTARVKKEKEKEKDKDGGEPATKKKRTNAKEDKGGASSDKPTRGRKSGLKSKEVIESEDDGERGGDAGPSKGSPQPGRKQKRDKDDEADPEMDNDPEATKVKEWRHKLQRGFLGKGPPKDEDMPAFDAIFTTVEQFDMNVKYLQFSKIGKVMRHISALPVSSIPLNETYKFKDRAQALVVKWHHKISAAKVNGAGPGPSGTAGAGTNGNAEGSGNENGHVNEDGTGDDANNDPNPNENDATTGVEGATGGVADMTFSGETTMGDITMDEP